MLFLTVSLNGFCLNFKVVRTGLEKGRTEGYIAESKVQQMQILYGVMIRREDVLEIRFRFRFLCSCCFTIRLVVLECFCL